MDLSESSAAPTFSDRSDGRVPVDVRCDARGERCSCTTKDVKAMAASH